MKMNNDIVNLFLTADRIAEENGFGYVPEIIGLGTLAMMGDSPLHQYLIDQGMEHLEIVANVKMLFEKYFPEEAERVEEYNAMIEESTEIFNSGLSKEEIKAEAQERAKYNSQFFLAVQFFFDNGNKISYVVITRELYDIMLMAIDIAQKMYNDEKLADKYMFAAFVEKMPDLYLELMRSCLGPNALLPDTALEKPGLDAMKNTFTLPRNLESFLTVMNDKYSPDEEYCKILGREQETETLIKILSKATKRNAILVGYPGVGKTAIVEKFVWSIVKGTCHKRFKDTLVLSLDVTSIVAGTKYRGTAEARFQELIKFLETHPGCILFIDEIHTVLGAGACKDGELDLANALKPILARGDTQVIGATTIEEYEKYFSKDGALKRRFEKILVKEPRTNELYDMIANQIMSLEKFHHTKISRELVDFTILNASCFNFESKNPDRTLDLLDRAMASAELKEKDEVDRDDILENFEIRRKQFERMSEQKKRATAYHEAGHYIVQRFSPELQYLHTLAVSIMPAEDYLGVNVFEEDEYETPSSNRDFYIQLIAKSLGGRRAEKLYTNELSAGASSDLTKATRFAKDMITRYGMDENFTDSRVYLRESENPMYTENIIEKISSEMDKILKEAGEYADKLLSEHRTELEMLVNELMEKGILSRTELEQIFKKQPVEATLVVKKPETTDK